MKQKEIRFIDSHYNELFRIKDGESITVKFSDGSMSDRKCTYIDDYHTKIGYNVFTSVNLPSLWSVAAVHIAQKMVCCVCYIGIRQTDND